MFDDSGALVRRNYSLSELDPGSAFSEAFQQSQSESFTFATWNDNELIRANMGEEDLRYGPFQAQEPEKLKILFGIENKLSNEEAKAQIDAAQLPLTVPENGYTQKALDIVMERKKNEIMRKTQMEDSTGFFNGTAQFSAGIVAQMLDPANVALSFVPVFAPAKVTAMLASASGAWGRAGIRAGVGAVEGGVGAAVVEPAIYMAKQREQADYEMSDSLWNIAFGTVLGGGLHAGTGAWGDFRTRGKVSINRMGSTGKMLDQASPETREAMLKTATQMEGQGYYADVNGVAAVDPALNPKIFVQRDPAKYFDVNRQKLKRGEYKAKVQALRDEAAQFQSMKGVDVNQDSIQDAIAKLGGISREAAIADGADPAGFKNNRAFRASGGMGFDEMAEALNQYGYTSLDGAPLSANDLVDIMVNGKDPTTVLSAQARRGEESDTIRELKKLGYSPEEITRALDKLVSGEKLGAKQQRIADDIINIVSDDGGRAASLDRTSGNNSSRTPEQAEREIMDYLSNKPIGEDQIDSIERLLDLMEDDLINGDEFVRSVKAMFVDMPGEANPGAAVKNTIDNGFAPENMRGVDKPAADEAETRLKQPERNADQELEEVTQMFSEYEKMTNSDPIDFSEFDQAIADAETDALALQAALTCRLTK